MSDFDETPDEQEDASGYFLPHGTLARFTHSLTDEQRPDWNLIRKSWKSEVKRAKSVNGKSERDGLFDVMTRVQGDITPAMIKELINNAVKKGDAQALRVIAQMAGMDLSDRPAVTAGEGARIIIIRPQTLLLTPAEEANVMQQINEI